MRNRKDASPKKLLSVFWWTRIRLLKKCPPFRWMTCFENNPSGWEKDDPCLVWTTGGAIGVVVRSSGDRRIHFFSGCRLLCFFKSSLLWCWFRSNVFLHLPRGAHQCSKCSKWRWMKEIKFYFHTFIMQCLSLCLCKRKRFIWKVFPKIKDKIPHINYTLTYSFKYQEFPMKKGF